MFRGRVRTIHFVGVGGIGMSGIAEVLRNLGFAVTGSDLRRSASVRRLESLGVSVRIGHHSDHVGDADVVVRSTAVDHENVEVRAALDAGIPVIRRAEMLAELMRLKYGVAVAGTHGKTTTTSMLAVCLAAGDLDPTIVIGGRLDKLGGSNARLGTGEYLVAEADESDGTFSALSPTVTVVTNIDAEHLDYHGSMEALERAFAEFANRVPFYGFSVLCVDHPRIQALLPTVRRRVVTFGFASHADYRAIDLQQDGVKTTFTLCKGDQPLGDICLGTPGRHNVQNALGAAATALELAIPFDRVREALHDFSGVERRFTVLGEWSDRLLVDDYGHHPVEIEATLKATAEGWPGRRIVAIFQPHRYSRVHALWEAFCVAFNGAKEVIVCPVYAAGEAPIEGVDHRQLVEAMRERGHRGAQPVDDLQAAVETVSAMAQPGDVILSLGAGNVQDVVLDLQRQWSGA